jgi:photosystem II stability/assembly factor-like uncharacterized protein
MKRASDPSLVLSCGPARALIAAGLAAILAVAGCSSSPTTPIVIPPLSRVVIAFGGDTTVVADTLAVGFIQQYTATPYDPSGNPVAGLPLAWRTTDAAVLRANNVGRVLGVAEGGALLIVEIGNVADTVDVLVLPGTTGWFPQVSNSTGVLNDVFFQADGRHGCVVGNGGEILTTADAGVTWTRQASNTLFNLNAVWFTDADSGWAVGNAGMALHTTDGGVTWIPMPTAASENLRDVAFATPDTGWAVGNAGAILRTVNFGASWEKQNPTPSPLYAVAFFGTRMGWAVGDNGVILGTTDHGVTWTTEPSVTAEPLRGVVRRSEFVAWAAGQQGVAPRTIDVAGVPTWELQNTGASNQLEDVYFVSDLIGYVCGWNGTGQVGRTGDGGVVWTAQSVPVSTTLNAVWFVDELRGWVVGPGGQILHTVTGGEP